MHAKPYSPERVGLRKKFDPAREPKDTAEKAARLVQELIPKLPPGAERRIEAAVRDAQKSPPEDKAQFVQDINRLLDVFQLRIQAEDGELYHLRVVPGATGRGYVQLRSTSKNRGFKNANIQVVALTAEAVRANEFAYQ